MGRYITSDDLRAYIKDSSNLDVESLDGAIVAAENQIDTLCGRYFTDDGTVSSRDYFANDPWCVNVDDFSTTTGLVIKTDTGYDGTFARTLTVADYFVEPVNGRRNSETVPYNRISAVGTNSQFGFLFPPVVSYARRPTIRVTAQWGWASIPDGVTQATKVLAAELFKLSDAPLGVAGFGEFGVVRVRENPKVRALLLPYMVAPIAVA